MRAGTHQALQQPSKRATKGRSRMGYKADARGTAYESGTGRTGKVRRAKIKSVRQSVMDAKHGVLVLTKHQSQRFFECITKTKEPTAEFKAGSSKLREMLEKHR